MRPFVRRAQTRIVRSVNSYHVAPVVNGYILKSFLRNPCHHAVCIIRTFSRSFTFIFFVFLISQQRRNVTGYYTQFVYIKSYRLEIIDDCTCGLHDIWLLVNMYAVIDFPSMVRTSTKHIKRVSTVLPYHSISSFWPNQKSERIIRHSNSSGHRPLVFNTSRRHRE